MRQLYAVSPKLFKVTPISENGSLCEVIIFNKGNQVEEEIYIDLDPELKLELLASDSSDIKLNQSTLSINRLHKGEEASALLLVEDGILDYSKLIKLSSKNASGKIIKQTEEVPPNYAKLFLGIVLALSILPALIYGTKGYEAYKTHRAKTELKQIHEAGWKNLSRYYSSDLMNSYSKQEFPVKFIETDKKNSRAIFEAYNKTAIPLKITVDGKFRKKKDYRYYENISIPPMSKIKFPIMLPKKIAGRTSLQYDFSFKFGEEFIYGVIYEYSYE
jgi:hypothetical protein